MYVAANRTHGDKRYKSNASWPRNGSRPKVGITGGLRCNNWDRTGRPARFLLFASKRQLKVRRCLDCFSRRVAFVSLREGPDSLLVNRAPPLGVSRSASLLLHSGLFQRIQRFPKMRAARPWSVRLSIVSRQTGGRMDDVVSMASVGRRITSEPDYSIPRRAASFGLPAARFLFNNFFLWIPWNLTAILAQTKIISLVALSSARHSAAAPRF